MLKRPTHFIKKVRAKKTSANQLYVRVGSKTESRWGHALCVSATSRAIAILPYGYARLNLFVKMYHTIFFFEFLLTSNNIV